MQAIPKVHQSRLTAVVRFSIGIGIDIGIATGIGRLEWDAGFRRLLVGGGRLMLAPALGDESIQQKLADMVDDHG